VRACVCAPARNASACSSILKYRQYKKTDIVQQFSLKDPVINQNTIHEVHMREEDDNGHMVVLEVISTSTSYLA